MSLLSQTFYVSQNEYPEGLYIESVDFFFQEKDSALPISVQFGPLVNGEPDEYTIYPEGIVYVYPSLVNVSSTGSTATNFKFAAPVYLLPGYHYFALKTQSNNYKVYTAVEGEFQFGSNKIITGAPYSGKMYLPTTGAIKNISEKEDIKFVLNRCVYNGTGNLIVKNLHPIVGSTNEVTYSQDTGSKTFDTFNVTSDTVNFTSADIDYSYIKTTTGNVVDAAYSPFSIGNNTSVPLSKLNQGTFKVKFDLSSNNNAVSPILDLDRINGVFLEQSINNDLTGETGLVGGNARAKYVTKVIELLPGIDANDLVAYAQLKLPVGTNVHMFYKAAQAGVNIVTNVNYIQLVQVAMGVPNPDQFVEYKFVTSGGQALVDNSYFTKFIVKIVLTTANSNIVPIVKDFRVIALND